MECLTVDHQRLYSFLDLDLDNTNRLGPCDLQDPPWVKMSAAVSGGVNKKRKKSETKPHAQAQINKCRNEKRRREQENIYIEELAELISASLADMSSLSVKPDKCAILKETVHRIQHIKQQEGSSSDAAVQQGEVSSSKPTILANEVFGPLLLEALEGFLFVVNTEGKVEYVTENVCQFIKYTKDDVLGQSIYNIIHLGDHARFSASLLPMSIGWTSEPSPNRNRSFNCRFLIKPPDNQDETMEEKQQRVSKYETMQISSTLLPYPNEKTEGGDVTSESAEVGPCLMCVARRIPQNEKPQGVPFEQFTTKLDVSGKIIGIDTSGVSSTYSQYLNKDLMGCIIQELCHQHDLQKLANHLKEALHTGNSTSAPYRLRVTNPDKYVHVQTKSKLFKSNGTLAQEPDFIMATHSIIGDNEIAPAECGHLSNSQTHSPRGGNQVATAGQSSSNGNSNAVGGPLMGGSSVNGQTSGASTTATTPRSSSGGNVSSSGFGTLSSDNTITLQTPSSYATYTLSSNELNLNDFDFFPTSTWDLGPGENSSTGAPQTPSAGWGERPDSRQSLTPVSTPTPRPPSIPGYSPNSPSPLNNPYSQPSPAGTNNRATTPANPFANSFPFSPLQDQAPGFGNLEDQAKDQSKEEESTSSQQPTGELGRLRNLLTNKRPSTSGTDEGSEGDESRNNEHRILKGLLNQEDKDEVGRGEEGSSRGMASRPASEPPKVSSSNNMLLRLLNEKSDDDDLEQQKQNELLQQLLLKKQDEERKDGSASAMSSAPPAQQQQEDPLLKSLGFPNPTPSPPSNSDVLSIIGTRKRPSEEGDEPSSKRPVDIHPKVSSSGPTIPTSGNSKLWEKNKMLASLLAKQPSQPTTIPPIPASIITATPQEKLPRVMDPSKQRPGGWSGGSLQPPSSTTSVVSTRPTLQQQQVRHLQQQQQQHQQQQQQQQQQRSSGGFISLSHSDQHHAQKLQHTAFAPSNPPVSTATAAVSGDSASIWDSQSSDPVLSDLLDQVIDFVPDNIIPDAAMLLLDAMESPTSSNYQQQDMNEKMMINAIQMKLMQCESAVKSPSSPTISLPGTPPAYTSTTTLSQSGGFPPPPTYQQRPRFTLQQATNQLSMRTAVAAAATQYTMGTTTLTTNQQMLLQQRKILHHNTIQQQKQRLLQQQQQQQVLMTSNAPAADQLPSGLQNIESLLNNTVAPNVSLQRSSSVPDSQLSPNYGGQMGAAQISPGQRQPYSPHSQLTSPLGQAAASQGQPQPGTQPQQQGFSPVGAGLNSFPSSQQAAQARLSPHPPGGLPSFQQSQLSPRISQAQPYQQGGVSLSQSSAQQQVAVSSWSQAAASRLSLQQQQNPMLNAQLTGAGGYTGGSGGANVRQFATQRSQSGAPVRSLPSPGAPGGPRQSPYPPEFPPPASPTAGANYQSTGQFQQQLRLQRTISAPSATTQLPGGVSSPRGHYGLKQEPLLSPIPPHHPMPYPDHLHHPHHPHPHHSHPHHMLYHQPSPPIADSQFCFDQTGIQIYGASERGRANHQPGGGNNGISSEYVRQELRAVVGARTQQQAGNGATRQQQQQLQLTQQVSPADLDALGLTFEMPSTGASDSQKLWGNIGSDLGSGSPQPGLSSSSRNTMEESPRPGDQKSSLLQKLLSE